MTSIFGKYTTYNTIIHRIDPRIKMFGLIAIMVACFLPYGNNFANYFLILGCLTIIILVMMLIARVSILDFFKSLKMMWFMALFLLIINVFIPYSGDKSSLHTMIAFSNGYTLYWEGLLNTAMVLLRLILMIALTMILTSTTSPMDITYALEWYLYPLKIIKFPTQVVAMTISLALRFIPTLLEKANTIMKAQKSRGVDYNRGFISKKVKSVTTLIVPLLVSCFTISDDLTLAMDARGYDPYAKRTSYHVLKFTLLDLFGIITILVILGLFIFFCVMRTSYGFDFIEFIFKVSGTF